MSNFYRVIEILDITYNEDVQYSSKWVINDIHKTDVFIDISKDPKDLCNSLLHMGFIYSSDLRKVSVSSMDKDIIDVREKKTLKPLCRLERARWMHL